MISQQHFPELTTPFFKLFLLLPKKPSPTSLASLLSPALFLLLPSQSSPQQPEGFLLKV